MPIDLYILKLIKLGPYWFIFYFSPENMWKHMAKETRAKTGKHFKFYPVHISLLDSVTHHVMLHILYVVSVDLYTVAITIWEFFGKNKPTEVTLLNILVHVQITFVI